MVQILLLRFDAPLMSFGDVLVDNRGRSRDFPALSMLAGLLANALGYDHADSGQTSVLQDRLEFAVRCDRRGELLTDYQTVDLGQAFLKDTGWTTGGTPERRAGASSEATHIRLREYIADAVYTVALTLREPEANPTLHDLSAALRAPERPLFLGRKSCVPSTLLVMEIVNSENVLTALKAASGAWRARSGPADVVSAWWPAAIEDDAESRIIEVTDSRDWVNQIHAGRRLVRHGQISVGST